MENKWSKSFCFSLFKIKFAVCLMWHIIYTIVELNQIPNLCICSVTQVFEYQAREHSDICICTKNVFCINSYIFCNRVQIISVIVF